MSGVCWRVNPAGIIRGKSGDYGKMLILMFADLKDYSARFIHHLNYQLLHVFSYMSTDRSLNYTYEYR